MAYSDRFPIVKNFFETRLVAACDAGATELHLADVGGLPAVLVGRDYIPLVLREATGSREIVYVESVDEGAGTVQVKRGQEGTIASSWNVGAYVYCTVTAESFQRMRVNGFAPMVDPNGGRPAITRTSGTAISITGDFTSQLEVGMAVRALSGDAVVAPADASLGAIFVGSVSYSGGKTLVGLQNVSLPSTVSGLDLGISVASAPLYHPDTPLGDGETITMEGGVLKIAAPFKQAQAAKDAEQDAAIAGKLDTSGGTMTGAIDISGQGFIEHTGQPFAGVRFRGKNGDNQFLWILNPDSENLPNIVLLRSAGHDVVFNAGGIAVDQSPVLTSAGGTLAGPLNLGESSDDRVVYVNDTVNGYKFILLQSGTWGAGTMIRLMRHDSPTDPGELLFFGGSTVMRVTPAGVVTVNGAPVISLVASWNNGNGNWYRKYSDGWIEQGGFVKENTVETPVTYHIPFANTNYWFTSCAYPYATDSSGGDGHNNRTTTGCTIMHTAFYHNTADGGAYWYACGY